jgi:uncharacterized membrane protein YjjP (DUF1212 family)
MAPALPIRPELLEPLGPSAAPGDARVAFALELGAALHRSGVPAHRLEQLLTEVSARLGLEARFFTTPTALLASFGPAENLQTSFLRVEPGEIDLGKLAELDGLTGQLIRGERTTDECARRLRQIVSAPPRYPVLVTMLCFGLAAGAGARLFGGGLAEVIGAGLLGLPVGALAGTARRYLPLSRVLEPAAAFVVSLLAVALSRLGAPLSVEVTTLAALFMLLPGLTLTVALTELATRHLISGTARLTSAALVFVSLAFGVALGGRVGALVLPASVPPVTLTPLPEWTVFLALLAATLSLVVLFVARRRDAAWIILAGVLAYLSARAGRSVLGPELGAFFGALVVGSLSNLVARLLDRPAVVTVVPGLMLLVPGSLGFRSLGSLLAQDVQGGVATAFSMVLVATAIVAGLLVSNALVPPRRAL